MSLTGANIGLRPTTEIAMSPKHPLFEPYCQQAFMVDADGAHIPIHTLHDTGAFQSVICEAVITPTAVKQTGQIRLLKGIYNQPKSINQL
jgi:hypothetical protein